MLIDQENANILPLAREAREGGLDRCGLGLGVDDEEVLLGIGRRGDMLVIVSAMSCL
jgi:hypothetical protein